MKTLSSCFYDFHYTFKILEIIELLDLEISRVNPQAPVAQKAANEVVF